MSIIGPNGVGYMNVPRKLHLCMLPPVPQWVGVCLSWRTVAPRWRP